MRKEEIHQIQRDTIHTTISIIEAEIEATITVQKTTIANIIHHVKDNTESILTKKEIDYLTNFKFTSNQFYCLPKVHKSELTKNVINTESSK